MTDELIKGRTCRPERCSQGWACEQWRSELGEWFCGLCGEPLPPVLLSLDRAIGRSAADGTGKRRVWAVCERTPATRDADVAEYELTLEVTDPSEQSDKFDIPLDAKDGRTELGLKGDAGGPPFDVHIGLQHKKSKRHGLPIIVGSFDYMQPGVRLTPQGPIALPKERGPFTVNLTVSPESRCLSARILVAGVNLAGQIEPGGGVATVITFDPDPAAWAAIETIEGPAEAELLVRFYGVPDDVRVGDTEVVRMTPAALRVVLAESTRGLTGRPARVAMSIRNAGGSAATIQALRWTLSAAGRPAVVSGAVEDFVGRTLDAQNEINCELRPALKGADGAPLPPGLYRLSVDVNFVNNGVEPEDKKISQSRSVELQVRPDQVFSGKVCIDFGTTDTAAAIVNGGDSDNYFVRRSTGQIPQPIELGNIGVSTRSSRFFLPTRAAIGTDDRGELRILFADAALSGVEGLRHGRLVDRLKWRLGEKEHVDGFSEQISIQEIVVRYLRHVRELIEEHPAVAARIEKVVATRPARFGLKTKILIDAFQGAGIEVDLESFGERVPPLVSESWPPVLFTLPFDEGNGGMASVRLLRMLFDRFPKERLPTLIDSRALSEAPHFLCTFDVGGGSTDISLLRLAKTPEQILISDLAAYTNERFAGEGFRDLIVGECALFVAGAAPAADVEGPPRENLDALRQFASSIQNFPAGPCALVYTGVEHFFSELASESTKERNEILSYLNEAVSDAWPPANMPNILNDLCGGIEQGLRASLNPVGQVYRLTLKTQAGAPVSMTFGDGTGGGNRNLTQLIFRIVLCFVREYDAAICNIFHKLVGRLDTEQAKGPVRVLLTGRGALFPIAEALIRARSIGFFKISRDDVFRSLGDSAKAVTSWGGLALRIARVASTDLEFTGLGDSSFALFGPPRAGGERPRAKLQPIDGSAEELWGLPLTDLPSGFAQARILFVGGDQDDADEPEELARLEGFNLKTALGRQPDAWLIFSAATNSLAIRQQDIQAEG